jgi:hypothetical protein
MMKNEVEIRNQITVITERYVGDIAEMLGCKPQEVIFSTKLPDRLPDIRAYMGCTRKKQIGSQPLITYGNANEVYGLALFKGCGGKFVTINVVTVYDERFPVIAYVRGDIYKIMRVIRLANKHKKEDDLKPILDESLYNSILGNTVNFIKNKRQLLKYGAKITKGVIFHGKPGNGKTLMCRHLRELCKKRGISTGNVNPADIESAIAQNTLSSLLCSNQVLFFDDIDISYFSRTGNESKKACAMLSAMDGLSTQPATVRIFTTNEDTSNLDPAFNRPGRIDKIERFPKPTADQRRQLVETWHSDIVDGIDVGRLVEESDDFSFAEVDFCKTLLVQHFINNGEWNLNKAMEEVIQRNAEQEISKKSMGFG